jgi:hypothetical protein
MGIKNYFLFFMSDFSLLIRANPGLFVFAYPKLMSKAFGEFKQLF